MAAVLAGCGESGSEPEPPPQHWTVIQVTPTSLRLGRRGAYRLEAAIVNDTAGTLRGVHPQYRSTDTTIVSVGGTGWVYSVGDTGAAEVVLSYPDAEPVRVPVEVVWGVHPEGVVVRTLDGVGAAFGVAISSRRQAYITNLDPASPILLLDIDRLSFVPPPVYGVGRAYGVAFNADGTKAYVPWADDRDYVRGRLMSIDVATGSASALTPDVRVGVFYAIVLSHDEREAFVGTSGGYLLVVDLEQGAVVNTMDGFGQGLAYMTRHPTEPLLYCSDPGAPLIRTVNMETREIVGELVLDYSGPDATAVSPDGGEIWVGKTNGPLQVLDLPSGQKLAELPAIGGWALAVSPDGEQVYVAKDDTLHIVDAGSRLRIKTVAFGEGNWTWRLAFSYDGATAIVATNSGKVMIIQ